MVVETMMAKNRDNRYRTPDDLILDLKCLLQGDSPMIAGQKADTLAVLAQGEVNEGQAAGATDEQLREMAAYVNGRNGLIAALAMLLALSVVTNVVFLTAW